MIKQNKILFINFYQLLANGMHIGHSYKNVNLLLDRFFVGRRFSVIILNLLTSVLNLRRAFLVLYGNAISKDLLYLLCLFGIILMFFFT